MKKADPDDCVPMRCAVCKSCCRARNWQGQLVSQCVFGGPFRGYTQPQE